MGLIKSIKRQVIASVVGTVVVVAVGAGAVYVTYEYFLDDEAKEGLRSLYKTMASSYLTLTGLVNERIGTIMDEDLVAQNRENVKQAWADLGF